MLAPIDAVRVAMVQELGLQKGETGMSAFKKTELSEINLEGMAVAKRKKTKRKDATRNHDPEQNIVTALLANELMNQMRGYLARGRRFSDSSIQELHRDWVTSIRGLFGDRDRKHERDYHDLTAEFQLRKIEPLYEPVRSIIETFEIEVMRRLNSRVKPVSRELDDKIEEVLREEKKPKH